MGKIVHIEADEVVLEGELTLSKKGVVLFAHGSGSSRHSPRNNFVAKVLQKRGFGTLLIDLLTEDEDQIYKNRFNIKLLTKRLIKIVEWLNRETKLPIALFGASTGAAAALEVAAQVNEIKAVVSRGGRPDLAIDVLGRVVAPTLIIVGANDFGVIELNQKAYELLKCEKKMEYVKGATHLFEERGCLKMVAKLASEWLEKYIK